MAATGSMAITANITGLPTGTKTVSLAITMSAAVGQVTDVTLASGDNTITVPSGATYAIIEPPAGNLIVLKLKGAGGDTGLLMHLTNPTALALASGQATFIINAASLTTGTTEVSFI